MFLAELCHLKLSRGQSFAKLCRDSRQGERTFDLLRLGAQDWLVRLPDGSIPQNMKKENPWKLMPSLRLSPITLTI